MILLYLYTQQFIQFNVNYVGDYCQYRALDFDAVLIEFNGEDDHVHLLINYPPKVAISNLVNSLKGLSSRHLRKDFPEIKNKLWGDSLWSPSYFASSCGGAPLEIIKQYIEQQQSPH